MNMYTVVEGRDYLEDVGEFTSFGLRAPSGTIVRNITTLRDRLELFAEMLNRNQASELHLSDLIYDFLVSPSFD